MRSVVPFLAATVLLAGCGGFHGYDTPDVGSRLPAFRAVDHRGLEVTQDDFEGVPTVVAALGPPLQERQTPSNALVEARNATRQAELDGRALRFLFVSESPLNTTGTWEPSWTLVIDDSTLQHELGLDGAYPVLIYDPRSELCGYGRAVDDQAILFQLQNFHQRFSHVRCR